MGTLDDANAGDAGNASSSSTVHIRLTAAVSEPALRAADGAELAVPVALGRKALRDVVHQLLDLKSSSDKEQLPDFHFLVNGTDALRSPLGTFLSRRALSTEGTLQLTYYLPLPTPNAQPPIPQGPAWLACIDAARNAVLLTGDFDGHARITSVAKTEQHEPVAVEVHAHQCAIKDVAFTHHDNILFATAGQDGTIRSWRAEHVINTNSKAISPPQITPVAVLRAEDYDAHTSFESLAANEKSCAIAAGAFDGSVWLIPSLKSGEEGSEDVADGKRKVPEATSLEGTRLGAGAAGLCTSGVAWGTGGIASAGWDGLVRAWDVNTCSEKVALPAGGKAVHGICAEEHVVVVACADGAVRIVDTRSDKGVVAACVKKWRHDSVVHDVQWVHHAESAVSVGDSEIKFWEIRALNAPVASVKLQDCEERALAAAVSSDGKSVYAVGTAGVVRQWTF